MELGMKRKRLHRKFRYKAIIRGYYGHEYNPFNAVNLSLKKAIDCAMTYHLYTNDMSTPHDKPYDKYSVIVQRYTKVNNKSWKLSKEWELA